MAHVYKHFIPRNIAPVSAEKIGVYDGNGKRICTIPLGGLTPPISEKLYSFGMVSDIHISHNANVAWRPIQKFNNALTLFENNGCLFCIACGDLTNTGFYLRTVESDASTTYFDETQFAKYAEICDKYTIPVYEICGNHDSYYGRAVTDNLDKLETYTGKGVLSYTVTQGDDVFIFVGQSRDTQVMSDEDLQWLYETLEANRNRRCFVFIHSHIDGDSGNPLNARDNSIFDYWDAIKTGVFKRLLSHYKNTVLFHGHTHMKFESQQFDECANYTEKNGFRSVHIPALATPRELNADGTWTGKDTESYGYVADVYDGFIVLNGRNFVDGEYVPMGVYKIDTTLVEIEAGTFTDSTGTITT